VFTPMSLRIFFNSFTTVSLIVFVRLKRSMAMHDDNEHVGNHLRKNPDEFEFRVDYGKKPTAVDQRVFIVFRCDNIVITFGN
jgi:spore coat polysaccharide biosynthesis protein SpsF (cytidylyltransferase family)